MKFTPEVIAALNTLKSAAENDFELHRINTLEQDLTTPLKVEVIDDSHQKFNGIVYRKHDNHFHAHGAIHRAVYTYYFGEIPEGYEIHHIDGNPTNNTISNLVMMTKSEHIKLHHPKGKPLSKEKIFICEKCGKEYRAFKVKNNRYCPDCRSTIEYHVLPRTKKTFKKICQNCNKEFEGSAKDVRFCSRHCVNEYLNKSKREVRTCPICGKQFKIMSSNFKQKTCSRECGYKYREMNCQKKA